MRVPKMLTKRASALVIAWVLAGCSLAPVHHRPEVPALADWFDTGSHWPAHHKAASPPSLDWRSFVADDTLCELVDLALTNNRELRQTLLNVEAARAAYRVQRVERLPRLQLAA